MASPSPRTGEVPRGSLGENETPSPSSSAPEGLLSSNALSNWYLKPSRDEVASTVKAVSFCNVASATVGDVSVVWYFWWAAGASIDGGSRLCSCGGKSWAGSLETRSGFCDIAGMIIGFSDSGAKSGWGTASGSCAASDNCGDTSSVPDVSGAVGSSKIGAESAITIAVEPRASAS